MIVRPLSSHRPSSPSPILPTLQILRSRRAAWAAVAVVMTLVAVLLYANLASPDQRIERPVPHRYGVRDPQFRRTMDRLMGPQFLPGNRVTALLNGDEAFPAMLAAIRQPGQFALVAGK